MIPTLNQTTRKPLRLTCTWWLEWPLLWLVDIYQQCIQVQAVWQDVVPDGTAAHAHVVNVDRAAAFGHQLYCFQVCVHGNINTCGKTTQAGCVSYTTSIGNATAAAEPDQGFMVACLLRKQQAQQAKHMQRQTHSCRQPLQGHSPLQLRAAQHSLQAWFGHPYL